MFWGVGGDVLEFVKVVWACVSKFLAVEIKFWAWKMGF